MQATKLLIIIIFILFITTGCIVKFSGSPTNSQGGIFATYDLAETWINISRLLSLKGDEIFTGVEITSLVFDPQVNSTIYAGTVANGVYFTLDGGRGWTQTLAAAGLINDIEVHPYDKCTIYVASSDRIYRSVDCARTWQPMLLELRNEAYLTSIAIDNSDDQPVIYVSTNKGGFYRSFDQAVSWQVVKFFEANLREITIDPANENIIYLSSQKKGIYKTTDRGSSWVNITADLDREYRGFNGYHKMIIAPADGSLILANDNGIFISDDQGNNWTALPLLTAPLSVYIYGLAVASLDSDKIYYSTRDTFYRSEDRGQNWITKRTPSSRVLSQILPSTTDEKLIFVGTRRIKN